VLQHTGFFCFKYTLSIFHFFSPRRGDLSVARALFFCPPLEEVPRRGGGGLSLDSQTKEDLQATGRSPLQIRKQFIIYKNNPPRPMGTPQRGEL